MTDAGGSPPVDPALTPAGERHAGAPRPAHPGPSRVKIGYLGAAPGLGVPHDPAADRDHQLHPVPGDARVAGAGHPARHAERDPGDAAGRPRAVGPRQAGLSRTSSCAYLGATVRGDLGFSFVARGQTGRRGPRASGSGRRSSSSASASSSRSSSGSRWARTRAGNAAARSTTSATASSLDPLLDAVLPARDGAAPHLLGRAWAGSRPFGMLDGRARSTTASSTALADFLVAPRPAARRRSRSGSSASTRSSCARRSSRRCPRTTSRPPAAMGLKDGRILRHHALPNALLPTVSLIAINLGYIVAGAITVEVVFNWPGLGTLTVEALTARDYPVLQGVFLLLERLGRPGEPRARTSSTARSTRGSGRDGRGALADRAAARRPRSIAASSAAAPRLLRRPEGLIGLVILVVFTRPGDRPGPVRRSAPDRGDRDRRAARAAVARRTSLGTDELGRDMLNLTVHGARISLAIGLLATLVTVVHRRRRRASSPASSAAWLDSILMRITDFFLVIPTFVLALILTPIIRDLVGSAATRGLRDPDDADRHRHRDRHHELVVDRPDHPVADAVAAGAGVRRPGPRRRGGQRPHHAAAHPAERHQPDRRQRGARLRRRRPDRDDLSFVGLGDPVPAVVGPAARGGPGGRRAGPRRVVVLRPAGRLHRPRRARVHARRQRPRRPSSTRSGGQRR